MSNPINHGAVMLKKETHPFTIQEVSYPTIDPHEVLVKNHAVAINPIDYYFQEHELFPAAYPLILGQDAAGEVVAVGSQVSHLQPGDRVIAMTIGSLAKETRHGAFQEYFAGPAATMCKIPASMSFSTAVVLPLGVATAAAGLYEAPFLNLPLPKADSNHASSSDKTVLIWGGASSVGANAIQLAKASGLKVVTTVSKRNFELVKSLGADQVFDYTSESVVQDVAKALKDGKEFVGAYDTISMDESLKACVKVVQTAFGKGKVVANRFDLQKYATESVQVTDTLNSISLMTSDLGPYIFHEYLPKALQAGNYQAKPDALVVGHGVSEIQVAVDKGKEPRSATKLVVTL